MEATAVAAANLAAVVAANGFATLTGITTAKGQCDACGRELGRVFQVRTVAGGTQVLGRRGAANATGYAATKIERMALAAARIAERDARRALRMAELTEAGHGGILNWLAAQPTAGPSGHASNAYMLLTDILDGAEHLLVNAHAERVAV
jgi:hypothetical protein